MARPITTHDNQTVQFYLCDFLTFKHYMDDEGVPQSMRNAVDDILTGVTRLDFGGNTRALSVSKIYYLLSSLPEITVKAVQEVAEQSESHCRKLAQALRVASRAIRNAMIQNGEG